MKILIETSALVSVSVFWEEPISGILLKDQFFVKVEKLFNFLRDNTELEIGIIAKTVENEAQGVLNKAVSKTIRWAITKIYSTDIRKRRRIMILQDVIVNDCIDRLEQIVVECSTRLPINTTERNRILKEEIEPVLKEIARNTVRFIQPPIPYFIKGTEFRGELTKEMLRSLPRRGGVYKGMPSPRDMAIMAEATMLSRKFGSKEKLYVASLDYHFIPNRQQVGSYLSGYKTFLDELDPTVRDLLAQKFGFIGEDPSELMKILKNGETGNKQA